MHELRHHTEEVHGKTQKVGLSSLFTIQCYFVLAQFPGILGLLALQSTFVW